MTEPAPETGADRLRTQLSQVIDDLVAGRITPAEANKITKAAGRELQTIEAALRALRQARRITPP